MQTRNNETETTNHLLKCNRNPVIFDEMEKIAIKNHENIIWNIKKTKNSDIKIMAQCILKTLCALTPTPHPASASEVMEVTLEQSVMSTRQG